MTRVRTRMHMSRQRSGEARRPDPPVRSPVFIRKKNPRVSVASTGLFGLPPLGAIARMPSVVAHGDHPNASRHLSIQDVIREPLQVHSR